MFIPQAIKKAASWYKRNYPGSQVVYLGTYNGEDAYYVKLPDDAVTGYPPVFVLRDGKAVEIIGEESLKVIPALDSCF